MSSINFDNVYWLFLMIPLAALLAVPFFIAVKKDNRNGHNIASVSIHIALAVIIAFAAAGTKIVTVTTKTQVYVVADVSYSTDKTLNQIDGYINNLKLPRNSELGLVCFAKDYELLTPCGGKLRSVKQSKVDVTETNITKALDYTKTLFSGGVLKRVVLITDGKQTYSSDSNELKRTIDSLHGENISVDAIFLDDNVDYDSKKEVQVSSVDYTKNAYLGNGGKALVYLQSTYEAQVIVTLYRGETEITRKAEKLTAGYNTVSFDLDASQKGVSDYLIKVSAPEDYCKENNVFGFTQTVTDVVKVLAVCNTKDDARSIVNQYADSAELALYVNKYITASDREELTSKGKVEVTGFINADEGLHVPYSVEDLCVYDEIVISDIDVTSLNNYEEFIKSVDKVVSLYGKSLLTSGNLNIQSSDNKVLRRLEDMLPVRYMGSAEDAKLYTIVIDSSRSMEQLEHFAMAKRAAQHLISILNPEDYVSVITFNGESSAVQLPVTAVNSDDVIQRVNDIQAAQGTYIGLGLRTAYEQMNKLPFGEKQLMLITDGLNYTAEADDPVKIAGDMNAAGIRSSVIDVGRLGDDKDGYNPDQNAREAKAMLESVAATGSGKYYYVYDMEELEKVLFSDVSDDVNQSVIEKETKVKVEKPYDEVLKNIDIKSVPDVSGYFTTRSKASAKTVLTVEHTKASGTTALPLYAYWNYGNGFVASFASSLSGAYTANWRTDGVYKTFFDNVLSEGMPSEKNDCPFTAEITPDGKTARLTVTPVDIRQEATATVEITKPDGTTQTADMIYNVSGYYLEFPMESTGKYAAKVTYNYADLTFETTVNYSMEYCPEYDAFATYDAYVLTKAMGGEGQVALNSSLTLDNTGLDVDEVTIDLTLALALIAAGLFLADVIVRKLKWADVVSFFSKGKGVKPKNDNDGEAQK